MDTVVLVGLYEEPERPPNAVDYIKRYMVTINTLHHITRYDILYVIWHSLPTHYWPTYWHTHRFHRPAGCTHWYWCRSIAKGMRAAESRQSTVRSHNPTTQSTRTAELTHTYTHHMSVSQHNISTSHHHNTASLHTHLTAIKTEPLSFSWINQRKRTVELPVPSSSPSSPYLLSMTCFC